MSEPQNRSLLASHDHPHLVLRAVLPSRPRARRVGGGRRTPNHPDRRRHADDLLAQVRVVRARFRARSSVLGVEPQNVVILDLHDRVRVDEIERAGLNVIEATSDTAMVAFADEPDMRVFVDRCRRFGGDIPPGQKAPPFESLIDGIRRVRPLTAGDVIAADLRGVDRSDVLRVDITGWCPEQRSEAEQRHAELRALIERAEGTVQDALLHHQGGVSVFRVDIEASRLLEIADTTRVRSIRRRPRPVLGQFRALRTGTSDLPAVRPPAPGAPAVAVVDSGLRADHPLISPAVELATSVGPLPSHDDSGHGTLVASLALYGSLEEHLSRRSPLRPAGRLVSVRVLDEHASFPDATLWEREVVRAIDVAAEAGARIVVLALGDGRRPYRPPGPVPVAALVDQVARRHDLVLVVSAGNTETARFPRRSGFDRNDVDWLLDDPDAGLLPPAMAALALTVGGVVGGHRQGMRPHRDDVHQVPLGQPEHPSGYTRRGPGVERAVKPDLCAPAGTPTFITGDHRVADGVRASHVVGAAGGVASDRLLDSACGTSFAAPFVAHAAAQVLGRYPSLSANAVRALLLAGAVDVETVVAGGTSVENEREQRRLTGHGLVHGERSTYSADHRAILLADGDLEVDGVHVYAVPIPRAFFRSRSIVVRVTVAHDPEVRATRLDDLANRMQVYAFRGVDVDDVRRRFEAADDDDVPENLQRLQLDLQPAAQTSCRGANQCLTAEFARPWREDYLGTDLVVVVRNVVRWPSDPHQRYALCLMLQTDEDVEELYGELRARLEALAEAELEIEAEA